MEFKEEGVLIPFNRNCLGVGKYENILKIEEDDLRAFIVQTRPKSSTSNRCGEHSIVT